MPLGVLNNISAVYAENNLNKTQSSLQNVLNAIVFGVEDQLRRGRSGRSVDCERPCGELRGSFAVLEQRQ